MNPTGYAIPPQQPVAPQPLQARRYDGQDGAPLYDTNTGGHYGEFQLTNAVASRVVALYRVANRS